MSIKRKSNPVAGVCAASRCTTPSTSELCDKHAQKDLESPAAASATTGTDLAQVKAEIEPVGTYSTQMIQFASTVAYDAPIQMGEQTVSGLEVLGHIGVAARENLKTLEEKRTTITKPLNAAKKAVDDLFRPTKDALEALIRTCNGRLADYERARRLEQQQALALVGQGQADANTLVAAHRHSEPLPESMATRKVFRIEIVNFSQVPDQIQVGDTIYALKFLNESSVQDLAKATGGACQIPGLRIYEDVEVRRS